MILLVTLCATLINASTITAKLPVLIAQTKYSRSSKIPSIEALIHSFDGHMQRLGLSKDYLAADASRMALVDGASAIETRFKDLWTSITNPIPTRAAEWKKKTNLLRESVQVMIGIFGQVITAHAEQDPIALAHADKGVTALKQLLDSLPRGPTSKSDINASILPQLAKLADDEARNLRWFLSDRADHSLCCVAEAKKKGHDSCWVTAWWSLGKSCVADYIRLSLVVTAIRSRQKVSDRLEGIGECVRYSGRFRTALAVMDILMQLQLYKTYKFTDHREIVALWDQVRRSVSVAHQASRISTRFFFARDQTGFDEKLREHRTALLDSFKAFCKLQQLIKI